MLKWKSECVIKEKERNTKSDPGEFLSKKVGYENPSLEKWVSDYIPHLQDNTLAVSCSSFWRNSWTFGATTKMCLSSPFVKASLEIFPFSLPLSSRGLSRSEGISEIPTRVPSQHLQVSWSSWITGAVFVLHPYCSFCVPQARLFPAACVAHPTLLMEHSQNKVTAVDTGAAALLFPALTLYQSSSSLREAVLINLVTCAHKSSGFLNNSPSASPTSWIITIWWSNF